MGDAAYQEVLDSLSSLISQKPKIGDQDAYAAAYVSMHTYLEVLYLMLVVSNRELPWFHAQSQICLEFSLSPAATRHGEGAHKAEGHSCSRH